MTGMANAGRAIASIVRGVVIACIASLCVVIYSAGALRRLAIADRALRTQHRTRSRGLLLRWSFTRLGATFIKIGQVASSRPDLFSPAVIAELQLLQDHVPAFRFGRVRAIVKRELGIAIEAGFREFDRVPIAAGSIAQVHRAVLLDGTEVAVKVVRPGVRARVRRDATLLLWAAHVAYALSSRARTADVIGHMRSLVAGIIVQTELHHEARNYERFQREFATSRIVSFPRVHMQHSTRDVLVMEFIHGTTINAIKPEHIPQVTRALREAFFAMCFEHGLVHADLHPGNVLVRDDGGVVLLDAGLVKHLSADVVEQIVDFARCLVMGDAHDLVRHLQTHHRYLHAVDWDAVAADAQAFIADLRARSMADIEVSRAVRTLFALARKHHIRPMAELSLVLLGIVTIEGIAKRLDPAASTMNEIARFLAPRVARRRLARGSAGDWPPASAAAPAGDATTPPSASTPQSPGCSRRAGQP